MSVEPARVSLRAITAETVIAVTFDAVVAIILGYPDEAPLGSPRSKSRIHWCDAA